MAASEYYQVVQQIYVSYFGRPADPVGLANYAAQLDAAGAPKTLKDIDAAYASNTTIKTLIDQMGGSTESNTLYAGSSTAAFVNAIYTNILNRAADYDGLIFWSSAIDRGVITRAKAALSIMSGALNDTSAQGVIDAAVVANKIAVASNFTTNLNTTAEVVSYAGDTAAATARAMLTSVTNTTNTTTFDVNATISQIGNIVVPGTTYTLTTGVDNLVGGSGNDSFNATVTATSATLGGLDKVDGGTGTDTLNVADTATAGNADFTLPAGFTITNIEALNVTTNGAIGTGGAAGAAGSFDISGVAGLTSATFVAAGAGTNTGSHVKAAGTTDVSLTVAGNNTATVDGGKAVTIVSGTAGTGAVAVTGSALTSVTVTGGGTATIDNTSATGTSGAGTTLTTVTLNDDAASDAVKGASLTTLNLSGQGAGGTARTITVTNGTANHTLTVNANGTGYQTGGTVVKTTTVADSVAKTIALNTTAASNIKLSTGGADTNLTSVTASGSGNLVLDLDSGNNTALASFDGSAATGNITLASNAVATTIKTGSGNDTFTATVVGTTKSAVDAGAGNDNVTISGALVAGSTVNLGAGNDHLIGTTTVATSATATSVIDGGDGIDTVSAAMLNAGNAALFKNFEGVSLNSTTGMDIGLLTGSTITGLYIDAASTSATYQNVTQAMGLTVSYVDGNGGANAGITNTLSMTGVSGTADAYTITFAADNSAAATAPTNSVVNAGTVAAAGIENFNIVSGGTKAWNALTLGADSSAKTVVVTGAANLDLAFAANFGSTTTSTSGVTSIDGSAATGKLSINTTNVAAGSGVTITVNGGSANDTITLGTTNAYTVNGGAGNDTIVTSTGSSTLTGGAGTDTFTVAATVVATATAAGMQFTTITDASTGDVIKFADKGTEVWTAAKVDVSTANALIGGTTNALDLAAAGDGSANGAIKWFQYGGNTYIVEDMSAGAAVATTDLVVKLTGLVDLSTATFTQVGVGQSYLTLA